MEKYNDEEVKKLSYKQRLAMLDDFGKALIEDVRDSSLSFAMSLTAGKSVNPIMAKRYGILSKLKENEREKVNDLLSETITNVIFDFLHLFADHDDKVKLLIKKDGIEYNYCDLTEHEGSEISCLDEDGWIQRFSKIGRFVL